MRQKVRKKEKFIMSFVLLYSLVTLLGATSPVEAFPALPLGNDSISHNVECISRDTVSATTDTGEITTASFSMMSSAANTAFHQNTVIIDDTAYDLDYFFLNPVPDDILEAIIFSDNIFLEFGLGTFVDAFNLEQEMTVEQKDAMKDFKYYDVDGTVYRYSDFYDDNPEIIEDSYLEVIEVSGIN